MRFLQSVSGFDVPRACVSTGIETARARHGQRHLRARCLTCCVPRTQHSAQLAKIGNRELCEAQFDAELQQWFVMATWTHTSEASTGKLLLGRFRWCLRVNLHALPVLVIRDDVEAQHPKWSRSC